MKNIKEDTQIEHRRKLFYTEAEVADVYDMTAELHTHHYGEMHEILLKVAFNHAKINREAGAANNECFILDIGSGTGMEALALLNGIPGSKVVALDLCKPMHDIFSKKGKKLLGEKIFNSRVKLITADIAGDDVSPEVLLESLRDMGWSGGYHMVVSALTLHHLSEDELRNVYKCIFRVLEPGGLFLNGDLFSYQSPVMRELAEWVLSDWIQRKFSRPGPQFQGIIDQLGSRTDKIKKSWIDHCKNENIPIPIEPAENIRHGENESQDSPSHMELLQTCGFHDIVWPYRFWQVGVLGATK